MHRPAIPSVVAILAICIGVVAAEPPTAPPPRLSVGELVRLLGSEDYAERESATRQLAALPLDAPPPELLAAIESPNPEVSRRASHAAESIRTRAEDRALGRPRVFAKYGRIDLFVAGAAVWNVPTDDEQLWRSVLDVAGTLARKAKIDWSPANGRYPVRSEIFWVNCTDKLFIQSGTPYQVPEKDSAGRPVIARPGGIRALEVRAPQTLIRNLVIASGPVRADNYISESVVLANGDVTAGKFLSNVILVCDGNVEVAAGAANSVVVARGNITLGKRATGSALIAGGKVTIRDTRPQVAGVNQIIGDNRLAALGFVTFFEPEQVGVRVEAVEQQKAVRVAKVMPNTPFAAAGVREGDIVTQLGEVKVASVAQFRTVLRDAVVKGEGILTLTRGGKTETLRVTFPE